MTLLQKFSPQKMDGVENKTQFAVKRYRDRLKKNKIEQWFKKKKTKKQLGKTHNVSQHM